MQRTPHLEFARNGEAAGIADPLSALLEAAAERGAERALQRSSEQSSHRVAYSPREWALAMGVSAPTVYRWLRMGMPAVRPTGATRIIPADALAWLRANSAEAGRSFDGEVAE